MPRPRPGNRCGLMALSKTILLLRAYVANACMATIAFCSSVIATNKKSKAYMRRPRGARNQRVTVRPKMAHISDLKAANACFQRKRDFSNSKSRARRKERESWYIVFSGIEGPHTSMTVRKRFSSNHCGQGVFPSQNLQQRRHKSRVSSRVAKFAFRRIFN